MSGQDRDLTDSEPIADHYSKLSAKHLQPALASFNTIAQHTVVPFYLIHKPIFSILAAEKAMSYEPVSIGYNLSNSKFSNVGKCEKQ